MFVIEGVRRPVLFMTVMVAMVIVIVFFVAVSMVVVVDMSGFQQADPFGRVDRDQ